MSSKHEIGEMLRVMQVRYELQQQVFRGLVAEENALRSEIARLDADLRASEAENHGHMRAIGADVIWKAWVGRTKSELNLKLARVLARKEHHIQQVRLAFGKVVVTQQLLEKATTETRLKAARSSLDSVLEQVLFGPGKR